MLLAPKVLIRVFEHVTKSSPTLHIPNTGSFPAAYSEIISLTAQLDVNNL